MQMQMYRVSSEPFRTSTKYRIPVDNFTQPLGTSIKYRKTFWIGYSESNVGNFSEYSNIGYSPSSHSIQWNSFPTYSDNLVTRGISPHEWRRDTRRIYSIRSFLQFEFQMFQLSGLYLQSASVDLLEFHTFRIEIQGSQVTRNIRNFRGKGNVGQTPADFRWLFFTGSPFSFLIPSAYSRPLIYSAFIDRFLSRRGLERTAIPCSSVIPIPRSCLPDNHATGFLSMKELGRPFRLSIPYFLAYPLLSTYDRLLSIEALILNIG